MSDCYFPFTKFYCAANTALLLLAFSIACMDFKLLLM